MSFFSLWAARSKQQGLEWHLCDNRNPAFSRICSVAPRISDLFIMYPQMCKLFWGSLINICTIVMNTINAVHAWRVNQTIYPQFGCMPCNIFHFSILFFKQSLFLLSCFLDLFSDLIWHSFLFVCMQCFFNCLFNVCAWFDWCNGYVMLL